MSGYHYTRTQVYLWITQESLSRRKHGEKERFGVQLIIQNLHVFMMMHLNVVLIMDMDLQIQNKNVAKKSR